MRLHLTEINKGTQVAASVTVHLTQPSAPERTSRSLLVKTSWKSSRCLDSSRLIATDSEFSARRRRCMDRSASAKADLRRQTVFDLPVPCTPCSQVPPLAKDFHTLKKSCLGGAPALLPGVGEAPEPLEWIIVISCLCMSRFNRRLPIASFHSLQ